MAIHLWKVLRSNSFIIPHNNLLEPLFFKLKEMPAVLIFTNHRDTKTNYA